MSHQEGIGSSARTRIHDITGNQVQSLLAKLDVLWETLPLPLRQEELLSPEFYTPGEAAGGGKHVLQEASILGHLKRIGALTEETTKAIELGAGTARLSDRLSRVAVMMDHVLIDRQEFSPGSCRDRHLVARLAAKQHKATTTHTVERVTADIASLDLNKYLLASSPKCLCLCLSKHLCGPACDLAIGSLGRVSPPSRRPPCAIATCCHYLCTWGTFSGKHFWETMGLTEQDFVVAVAASQWASVNKKQKKATPPDNNNNNNKEDTEEPSKKKLKNGTGTDTKPLDTTSTTATCWLTDLDEIAKSAKSRLDSDSTETTRAVIQSEEFERTFSRADKSALGWKLKQLLDLCRAARLQELGYNVDLVVYTTRSLEDRLLVASQSK